jgi:hypothetical protein
MKITSDFQEDLGDVLVEEAIDHLMADGGPVEQAIEQSHEILRAYGQRNDYSVDSIIESLQEPEVERTANGFRIRWGWEAEHAPYFEWGTSDHVVDGDPILSFVWSREDAPAWVAEEFEPEGDGYRVFFPQTEPSRLPEARFARSVLDFLRREVA